MRTILYIVFSFYGSIGFSQTAKLPALKIIPYDASQVSYPDTIYLKTITADDLQRIVRENENVLVHIWYPWCAEQQKEIGEYAEYQRRSREKGVVYLFIADNAYIAGTIPALFNRIGMDSGYVIPPGTTLKSFKKTISKTFSTRQSKHTVLLFQKGHLLWEGYSYNSLREKLVPFLDTIQ